MSITSNNYIQINNHNNKNKVPLNKKKTKNKQLKIIKQMNLRNNMIVIKEKEL